MCFEYASRPPLPPFAGGAVATEVLTLRAEDGTEFAAFSARAEGHSPTGIVILPDIRGLHPYYEELAIRFAEQGHNAIAIDYFGRTAGVGRRGPRRRLRLADARQSDQG